ncbi:hypothetical protein QBC43DRAFT_256573 [Cladorrhinum sp. PSN259]|nr:hypothetical protein QBC43DRAFT_256573 [Cladorrhinum sp. PSN259]
MAPDTTTAPSAAALLPVKLDAFILNPSVCNGGPLESKITPITQPNYTYLRIDQRAARTDVLSHADLHLSSPSTRNPRITNLSTRKPRPERQGVYLHWTIPKLYRSGVASASQDNPDDQTAPSFPLVPNRWMVVRRLRDNTVEPPAASTSIPSTEAWIVESDRRYRIDELDEQVDLQTDVSPFMDTTRPGTGSLGDVSIVDQAEIFIGDKKRVSDWKDSRKDPRARNVNLHILTSSNPLFADYQPHNANVFSILDTFPYNEVKDEEGKVISCDRLTKATADYYVIGWHSDTKDDVLFSQTGGNRRQRLEKLALELPEAFKDSTAWLNSSETARIICHGAMYEVKWDINTKPHTPADDWSLNLNHKQQVSVGTSPIDALLAYVTAHHEEKPSDPKSDSTMDIRQLEEDIFNLRAYLPMQETGSVEAYRKASDTLMHANYGRSSGGKRFAFPASSKGGEKPNKDALANLQALNNAQDLREASMRSLKRCRWDLFSLWFKHFSTADTSIQVLPKTVQRVQDRFDALERIVDQQATAVEEAKKKVGDAIEAVHPEYHQQGDPTIMVGGVKSGWAHDFLDKVKVRLDTQTVQASADALKTLQLSGLANESIPTDVWDVTVKLLGEFCALADSDEKAAPDNQLPLYHDTGIDDAPLWRDRWNNRQPWFPLFVEWEAEYVHVPWDDWKLANESVSASSGHKRTRYGIDAARDLSTINDRRTVSGRILILPQPSFALKGLIEQLFSTIPKEELNSIISEKERENLGKNVLRLPFLSAPLSGLADHLITLAHGTHIKPSVRAKGEEAPQPIREAVDEGGNPMFSTDRIKMMGLELDPTPYGAQIHVAADNETPCPFKPVTHGQLRFTKLNVIDKFGQAIHALQPRGSAAAGPILDTIIPCVGEFYEVSSDPASALSEFIQLPPSINQPARINAHFVKRESTTDPKSGWRPTTEWEDDHIWGWVVINYLDHGIQLFTAKGTFYREVRLPGTAKRGRTGGVASAKWLPFEKTDETPNTTQLDQLVSHLTEKDGVYLKAFLDMINGALEQSGPAPGQYAEALNCIVGKPLALVNMGWSLELATAPNQNQSTLNTSDPEKSLYSYPFPIKLGDSHREYDGLVGYFPAKRRTEPHPSRPDEMGDLPLNNEFELEKLYTYFGHSNVKGPLLRLDDSSYPRLPPYFLDPTNYDSNPGGRDPESIITPRPPNPEAATKANSAYFTDHNSHLQVFAAVIDPFQPIHGYSGFLPIKELKLLDWTWQQALNRMTAFFHVGPLMSAKDVPNYNLDYQLRAEEPQKQKVWEKDTVDVLPTGVDEWNWLQPYFFEAQKKEVGAKDDESKTRFMPIKVGRMDTRPRFEKAPYTAIEGYLQMRRSLADAHRGGSSAGHE